MKKTVSLLLAGLMALTLAGCSGQDSQTETTEAAAETTAEAASESADAEEETTPEAEDAIPNYYSRAEFTAEEFRERVLAACPEADLSGDVSGWLQNAVTDAAGSVQTVDVGGVSVKGSRLRSILGLRSACFEWEARDGGLVFYVTGFGHGVGLSQYGANRMASEGADYREILTHYYTGVSIGPCPAG